MVTSAVACRSDDPPQNDGDEQPLARVGLAITADAVIVRDATYNEYVEHFGSSMRQRKKSQKI